MSIVHAVPSHTALACLSLVISVFRPLDGALSEGTGHLGSRRLAHESAKTFAELAVVDTHLAPTNLGCTTCLLSRLPTLTCLRPRTCLATAPWATATWHLQVDTMGRGVILGIMDLFHHLTAARGGSGEGPTPNRQGLCPEYYLWLSPSADPSAEIGHCLLNPLAYLTHSHCVN